MRPTLLLTALCWAASLGGTLQASDCVEEDCDGAYCNASSCERVPLPEHPGPHRCVVVPARKEVKKTVYETKWVPYCLPKPTCPDCHGDCDRPCPRCEKCVRWKRVLVKREVVDRVLCTYECVPQPCGTATSRAAGLPPEPTSYPEAPPAPPATKP